jgi:hypothetical protein
MAITSGFDDRRSRGWPAGRSGGCGKPDGGAESVDIEPEMSVPDG